MKNLIQSRPLLAIVFALVLSTFIVGCASMRAASARSNYIHNATEAHVYQNTCDQIWPQARQLLFNEGFEVKNTGEGGGMTLETEWKYRQGDAPIRYLVQSVEPSPGQCQVMFSMNIRETAERSASTGRDLDIEWELLQQADPAAAAQISQEAEIRGQQAANG